MGQRYSSTLSLTSALDGGGWSTPHPGRFTPGKDPVPIALEAGWVSEPVWMGTDNPAPTRIRSPDCPGRSESLYWLSYPSSHIYTGCPRRNVPDFGRVFLMLKYTDITQNTYVQSSTVTEIMAREKCGLLAGPRTVPVSWEPYPCPPLSVVSYYGNSAHTRSKLFMYCLLGDKAVHISAWHSCHV